MDASFITINIAYFLYVAATIPKRIVALRLTLIVASIAFIIYGIIDSNRSVIVWNLLFTFPQMFQLFRELRLQRSAALTADEEAIRVAHFGTMSPRDFLMFWNVGEERITTDAQLITEGQRNEALFLILDGTASISIDDSHEADRGPGNLLGEASFVTGEPATATVVMPVGSHIRMWPHDKLEVLTRAQPDMAASLVSVFANELSKKIKTRTS